MSDDILHDTLPYTPWMDPALWRLPGLKPLDVAEWLVRDAAFDAQMALRDRLIADRPGDVHAMTGRALPAARECLDMMLEALRRDSGYRIGSAEVVRPDGVSVPVDQDAPLATMGRLTQADVCLMQEGDTGHVLTGAILCFPASWTLAEKIGRPLMAIHGPVASYDGEMARRVQRLFDAIRPDQLMWRANAHRHWDAALYHPRSETDPPEVRHDPPGGPFLRSERQVLRRLPDTNAVVFTIHTTMIPVSKLDAAQRAAMAGTRLADV